MRSLFERTQRENRRSFFYSIVGLFFYILSVFYWLGYRLRIFAYQSGMVELRKLKAKVISIGNITLGGTGKTPLVIYLAQKLKERGVRVAVLTRGYKREKKELVELTGKSRNRVHWTDVGDEPYLLASRLDNIPVAVFKDRWTSGARAEKKHQAEVLILDDGFQHWRLFRDLDIVVIDSTNPFGNLRLFPGGILREPLPSLKRADIFLLTKADQAPDKRDLVGVLRSYNQDAPVIESTYRVNSIERLFACSRKEGDPPVQMEEKALEGKKVLAFSGIGNPVSFEKTLQSLKVEVSGHGKFPDHFAYREADILKLERQAQKSGADLMITTEKDSVRIPMMNDLPIPIYVLKVDLVIMKGEELLWKEIEGLLYHGDEN